MRIKYTDTSLAVMKIMDVLGGSDGGVDFTKFYHGFLPSIQRDNSTDRNLRAIILNFANLLEVVLETPNP